MKPLVDFGRRAATLLAGRRTKFLTLALWVVMVAVAAPLGAKLADVQDNAAVNYLPRTAEATRAYERAQDAFPDSARLLAVAVYARDTGLRAVDRDAAEQDRAAFAKYAHGGVPKLTESEDGKALLLSFPLDGDDKAQSEATGRIKDLLDAGKPAGLRVGLTGSAGAEHDVFDAFSGMGGAMLLATAGVVVLVLLFTYRSPVLWLVPLVSVAIASQVASAVVYLLARYADVTVNLEAQSVFTILVFGAGTDYALLLIARYREELVRHADRHEAMTVALRRSFPAVLASAATVAIGLLCLLAAEMNSTRGLGPVAAVGVIVALVAMTTLLPALMVVCGRWLFWPFVPRHDTEAATHDVAEQHGVWSGIARLVGRAPRTVWLASVVLLGVLALGSTGVKAGLPFDEIFTKEVGSVTGQKLIADHFPGGTSSPVEIVARSSAADDVAAAAAQAPGVASARAIERSDDGRWVRVQAVLRDQPEGSRAHDVIDGVRDAVHSVRGADALVGGDLATQVDTDRGSVRDAKVVIPLILAAVLLVLVLLLRALVAPVLLIASVVLSYGAALGLSWWIFQAMGHSAVYEGLPLQTFVFLVALGVDYTIFLMSRAREESRTLGHRRGILHSLAVTGGVITSAGLVLAATFSALHVLPMTPSVQIGTVVAVGVLLDTLVVRSLLIPAFAVHIGPKFWWPAAVPGAPVPPVAPVAPVTSAANADAVAEPSPPTRAGSPTRT